MTTGWKEMLPWQALFAEQLWLEKCGLPHTNLAEVWHEAPLHQPLPGSGSTEILRRKPAACCSKAPVVSATHGKNSTPWARHAAAVSRCACLTPTYADAAARLVRAASPKVSCRKGAVTAKSKAVGEPR